MSDESGSPPSKGSRWIADQIAAALESSAGGPAPVGRPLGRTEIDDLVSRTLDEELERLEQEGGGDGKDPHLPCP